MVFEIFDYKISPYSGNTCWKIQERSDPDAKTEWKEPNYFPTSFKHALELTRELCLRNDKSQCKTVDELINRVSEIDAEFKKCISKIKIDSSQ